MGFACPQLGLYTDGGFSHLRIAFAHSSRHLSARCCLLSRHALRTIDYEAWSLAGHAFHVVSCLERVLPRTVGYTVTALIRVARFIQHDGHAGAFCDSRGLVTRQLITASAEFNRVIAYIVNTT